MLWLHDVAGSKKNQSLGTSAIQALASGNAENKGGSEAVAAPAANGSGDPT